METFSKLGQVSKRGFAKGRKKFSAASEFSAQKPKLASDPDDEIFFDIAYRMCGDLEKNIKLAKRFVSKQQQPGFENLTLPEAIYMFWLEDEQVEYEYQTEINGGRLTLLGAVPDFLLIREHILVLVNGTYFHDPRYFPGKKERDELLIRRMMSATIDGHRVTAVVVLWENDILGCQRDFHFTNSINGIETSSPPWGG